MKKVIGSDIITSMTSGPLPLSRNQINSSFFSFLCIHTMYKARLYILYAIAEPSQCISAPSMQRICAAMLSSYIGVSFFSMLRLVLLSRANYAGHMEAWPRPSQQSFSEEKTDRFRQYSDTTSQWTQVLKQVKFMAFFSLMSHSFFISQYIYKLLLLLSMNIYFGTFGNINSIHMFCL